MSSDFRSIKVFSTPYRARVLHGFRKTNIFLLKITKQFVRLKAILFYFILSYFNEFAFLFINFCTVLSFLRLKAKNFFIALLFYSRH